MVSCRGGGRGDGTREEDYWIFDNHVLVLTYSVHGTEPIKRRPWRIRSPQCRGCWANKYRVFSGVSLLIHDLKKEENRPNEKASVEQSVVTRKGRERKRIC